MVAGHGDLACDWDDLLWAALTVGRPNTAYVLAHGEPSYHEALFRLSLVRMALEQDPGSAALRRTDAYRALDPTEKGAVSYFLGMAVCRLFAARFLGTTWLLHLDVFREQLDPDVLGGRSRPDLVGLDVDGAWHAFECKGRSSVPDGKEMLKAKQQAQRLVRVGSRHCSLHVGAISYFRGNCLEFHWRDPEPEEDQKPALEVTLPDDVWRHYYRPALALATGDRTVAMSDARTGADVDVEIHTEVRERLQAGEWAAARAHAQENQEALLEAGFRRDGLKVEAGETWTAEQEAHREGR